MEKFVLVNWDNRNLAFQLNDVKEVITGEGKGKNLHPSYKGKAARKSYFKILTNKDYLIPSHTKPVQIKGQKLKLDEKSSTVLEDKYDFVAYNNGHIAVSIRNV